MFQYIEKAKDKAEIVRAIGVFVFLCKACNLATKEKIGMQSGPDLFGRERRLKEQVERQEEYLEDTQTLQKSVL
jgi:hypothetical protein